MVPLDSHVKAQTASTRGAFVTKEAYAGQYCMFKC